MYRPLWGALEVVRMIRRFLRAGCKAIVPEIGCHCQQQGTEGPPLPGKELLINKRPLSLK